MSKQTFLSRLAIRGVSDEESLRRVLGATSLPRKWLGAAPDLKDKILIGIASLELVSFSVFDSFGLDAEFVRSKVLEKAWSLIEKDEFRALFSLAKCALRIAKSTTRSSYDKDLAVAVNQLFTGSLVRYADLSFSEIKKARVHASSYFSVNKVDREHKVIHIHWPENVDTYLTDVLLTLISIKGYSTELDMVHVDPDISASDELFEIMGAFNDICKADKITYHSDSQTPHNALVAIACEKHPCARRMTWSPYAFLEKRIQKGYESKLLGLILSLMRIFEFEIGPRSLVTPAYIWESQLPVCKKAKNRTQAVVRYAPWGWHKVREVKKVRKGRDVVDAPASLALAIPAVTSKAKNLAVASERYKAWFMGLSVTNESIPRLYKTVSLLVQLSQSEKKWLYSDPDSSDRIIREMDLVLTLLDRRVLLSELEDGVCAATRGDPTLLERALHSLERGEQA